MIWIHTKYIMKSFLFYSSPSGFYEIYLGVFFCVILQKNNKTDNKYLHLCSGLGRKITKKLSEGNQQSSTKVSVKASIFTVGSLTALILSSTLISSGFSTMDSDHKLPHYSLTGVILVGLKIQHY